MLGQSLDQQAISRGLVRQAVPFLGDLCDARPHGRSGLRQSSIRARLDRPGRRLVLISSASSADQPLDPLSAILDRVLETGAAELAPADRRDRSAPIRTECARLACEPAAQPHPATSGRARCSPFRSRSAGRPSARSPSPAASPARPSDPTRFRCIEDLAARASVAVENARLYRHVQENDRRKNEFLAMLAHELRNPLAPIRSAAELLKMLEIEDENLGWASEVISTAG